jgi:Luciferase-like monooxygenase
VPSVQVGVVFPQTELGGDVGAVRAYGQGVEALGFSHLLAYDHVLGADPAVHAPWHGPYDLATTFHEPFVMFGYLAGVTTAIELVTGIIILPQRQTALVAKQAAEVDLLAGGRFRLGVGLGWNAVEYEALGQRFDKRGRRLSESACCGGCGRRRRVRRRGTRPCSPGNAGPTTSSLSSASQHGRTRSRSPCPPWSTWACGGQHRRTAVAMPTLWP